MNVQEAVSDPEGRTMRCEILLTVAMVLSQNSNHPPSPPPTAPTPSPIIIVAPAAAPPTASPSVPAPTLAAPPPAEHVTPFDADHASLDWSAGDWRIVAGGVTLKDFGRRESDAHRRCS